MTVWENVNCFFIAIEICKVFLLVNIWPDKFINWDGHVVDYLLKHRDFLPIDFPFFCFYIIVFIFLFDVQCHQGGDH